MARRDIRDVTPLGIKSINDNFIDLSYEVFGNASFAKKVEKRVTQAEIDIVEVTQTADGVSIAINTTTHQFTKEGYFLKDSNGEMLLTPNGVANEQNIGRADNAENGYPMMIPFRIGIEVSQIRQAVLEWDISPFRTYSKGAKSGGGSTSGDGGSWSSTVGVYDWTQGLAADTSGVTIDSNNLGIVHAHTVSTSNLGHRHSVAVPDHQHSTPNHTHPPEFGILMTPITDYTTYVHIDGVHRTTLTTQRGEVDLSAWITTSGWHTIEFRTPVLKRIDANLFLKTYIRR